jgi:ABC-type maltose transport system permease subunit
MGKFLAGPVGSWLRVWLATALTALLTDLASNSVSLDWKAYAIAGVVAVLPIIIAFLNAADTRYGRGSA